MCVCIFIHTHILHICVCISGHWGYSKSLTYRPSSGELSKIWMWIHMSNHVRHEWNCSLPSVSYCWQSFSSAISHLLSLPVSSSSCLFTQCQLLYASCHTVLVYLSRYYTVRLKKNFLIFYYFGCTGSFLLCGLFSGCGERASHCSGFPCQSTGFRCIGFNSCGMWAQLLCLPSSRA